MNKQNIQVYICAILMLLAVFSCGSSSSQNVGQKAVVEKKDSCSVDPHHTYQLYLPVSFSDQPSKSFFILIDSHGDGNFAMKNFKLAADKYGIGLIASNRIKNNDPDFLKEIGELQDEVKNKYDANSKIFLAGFSGGARMALVYALNSDVDGVIACGALAGPDQLYAIECPVIGVVGMDDFNFMEVAQYLLFPEKKPEKTHLVLTNDSHAWPEKEIVSALVGQLVLSDKDSNTKEVETFVNEQKKWIQSLNKKDNILNAACVSQNMSTVPAFEKSGDFSSVYKKIVSTSEYNVAMKELAKNMDQEISLRKSLLPAFLKNDSVWWKNEIILLQQKAEKGDTRMEEMTYKRILGFVGIACYSMSRQFLNKKDVSRLKQILMVYRLAEPENEDMKHFTQELKKLEGDKVVR